MTIPLKIYKGGWTASARSSSRNYNDLRDNMGTPCSGRSEMNFRISLRQFSASLPPPRSREGHPKLSDYRVKPEPVLEDWFYNDPKYADVRYGNLEELRHLLLHPVRFRPKSLVKWQIDLRGRTAGRSCFQLSPRSLSLDSDVHFRESFRRVAWERSLRGLVRDDEALIELIGRKTTPSILSSDPKLRYLSMR